jgi:hypothetical protein
MNVLFPDDTRDRYILNVLKRQKITTICDKHFLRMIRQVVKASNRWQAGRGKADGRQEEGRWYRRQRGGRQAGGKQTANRRQAGK